jgi:acylphosphatase
MTAHDDTERREVYYRGNVQGIGFRYTARWIAIGFAVTGFVQNLPDGRVLLVAEGTNAELDRFLASVAAEMGRYIDEARVSSGPATGEFGQFGIRF